MDFRRIFLATWFYLIWSRIAIAIETRFSVTSPEDSAVYAMKGYGTDLQCFVNGCVPPGKKVKWFKDDQLIAEGTSALSNNNRLFIRHTVNEDKRKVCQGGCSSTNPCAAGYNCVDNACCVCDKEEFTLLIHNLAASDDGTYQCKLDDQNYVEFQLTVMEEGLSPTFAQNITFDYVECCQRNDVSEQCLAMCKPQSVETHKFDPVPCHKEFDKLLQCTSHNGNVSHVHCCRLQFVPQVCWEFCSLTPDKFENAKSICLYWMPEIFQCFEQVYLPLPGNPETFSVTVVNASTVHACWNAPHVRPETVSHYTLRYQELPDLGWFGNAAGEGDDGVDYSFEETPRLPHEHGTEDSMEAPASTSSSVAPSARRFANEQLERKKRQSIVVTTYNFDTNETDMREYHPLEINTTDTCAYVDGLKPSTRYTMYVKAVNDYGTSLPSLRASIVTANVDISNASLPDVRQCCSKGGVDPDCADRLCDITQPHGKLNAFSLAFVCRNEFPRVAPCLADGRDHTPCCLAKNVGRECMNLCNGSTSALTVSSMLCLSLDMISIYSCLHEGYVTHPSPPTNVSIDRITGTSAVITWTPPESNGEKVISYSLFHREGYYGEYKEVRNVTSPFELDGLRPDALYSVHLIAYTPQGKSLKSTSLSFFAGEKEVDGICAYGQPLLDEYGEPVLCRPNARCPELFECVDSETDDEDASYCCPKKPLVEPDDRIVAPSFSECCSEAGVTGKCLKLCSYDETGKEGLLKDCISHIGSWLECGGGGRDNRPCCDSEHVPKPCTDFCYYSSDDPTQYNTSHGQCADYVHSISKCSELGIRALPGPPRFLRHLVEGPSWASIRWDEPLDTVVIDHYEVHFSDGRTERVLNSSALSVTINELQVEVQYSVKVRSLNSAGASVFTPKLNFSLDEGSIVSTEEEFPSQPSKLTVLWYRNRTANLTWTWDRETFGTGKSVSNYNFNVSYGESLANGSRVKWNSVITKDYFAVVDNLKENATYNVYVTARDLDTKVEGIPSSVISFRARTAKSPPWAEIEMFPEGPFRVGDRIEASCIAGGDPVPNVTIEGFGRMLATAVGLATAVFEVSSIDDANEDILCSADNGHFVPFQATYTLKVLHQPQVYAYLDPVHVIQDVAARLVCRIRSYPTADVTWQYQSESDKKNKRSPKEITISEKYDMDLSAGKISNSFNATLTVYQAEPKDIGFYHCNACNDLGCANASQQLIVDPYPVPPGPDYILECCKKQRIRPDCASACTIDIDVKVYETNMHCVSEFPKLMYCSKDGIDHSECCSRSGVPDDCLSYCNRRLATDEGPVNLDSCGDFTSDIISCVEEGHQVVPLTPMNLRVRILKSHSFNISWDSLDRDDGNVPLYVVYFKRRKEQHYAMARTENSWMVLRNVDTSADYNVTVIAANRNGFSMFAPIVTVAARSGGVTRAISTRSAAGTVVAILFFFFLACVVIGTAIYCTRRPQALTGLWHKLRGSYRAGQNGSAGGTVAFENPGYDKEAQVHVMPSNGATSMNPGASNGPAPGNTNSWERAELGASEEALSRTQRGMRYTQFS